jgi:hypothetical protein
VDIFYGNAPVLLTKTAFLYRVSQTAFKGLLFYVNHSFQTQATECKALRLREINHEADMHTTG